MSSLVVVMIIRMMAIIMTEMKKVGMIMTTLNVTVMVRIVMWAWRGGWDGGDYGDGDGMGR